MPFKTKEYLTADSTAITAILPIMVEISLDYLIKYFLFLIYSSLRQPSFRLPTVSVLSLLGVL